MDSYNKIRLKDVVRHKVGHDDFLDQYRQMVSEAAQQGRKALSRIAGQVMIQIADARNLRVAFEFIRAEGGPAPGYDNLRCDDLCHTDISELLRAIEKALKAGGYRPGQIRVTLVSKGPGRDGTRPIKLLELPDRVVQRAITQIIGPLAEHLFDDRSFGGRMYLGRWHALVCLENLLSSSGGSTLLSDDVSNAFEQVPIARLMQLIEKDFPDEEFVGLMRTIFGKRKRGVPQGAATSPLWLNQYLTHNLDRPWRDKTAVPLIRYVDDVLLVCKPSDSAADLYQQLSQQLRVAGLPLKGTFSSSMCDLSQGESVSWLGYFIAARDGRLEYRLPVSDKKNWLAKLTQSLLDAHKKSDSQQRAREIIRGIVEHAGPCFPYMDHEVTYQQISEIAREQSFEEIDDLDEFLKRWEESYRRWCKLHNAQGKVPPGKPVVLHASAACLKGKQCGYALVITTENGKALRHQEGSLGKGTQRRAELTAVIKGLEATEEAATVCLAMPSRFITDGMGNLTLWKNQNWLVGGKGNRRPLENADLWRQLEALLQLRTVTVDVSHAGFNDRWNEICAERARAAARSVGAVSQTHGHVAEQHECSSPPF